MPLLNIDIFSDLAQKLRPEVNPYVALLIDAQENASLPLLAGTSLLNSPGAWHERFPKAEGRLGPEQLILEIGSHFGKSLLEMAQLNPQKAFVGMAGD